MYLVADVDGTATTRDGVGACDHERRMAFLLCLFPEFGRAHRYGARVDDGDAADRDRLIRDPATQEMQPNFGIRPNFRSHHRLASRDGMLRVAELLMCDQGGVGPARLAMVEHHGPQCFSAIETYMVPRLGRPFG